ncbi:hypothetical protein CGB78_26600 [Klebsiella pneumoniae]|nr:hypothetical protein [Klebsiella pneumoniae]OYJ28733.1 hypothetical protein CI739_22735 [Klebsiella pneumoniae subsp. pneumoniae]OYM01079.1 hypothetical protein CI755_23160 [Klebsiella pneumoniae subsp. pneumoniae]OYM03149.1 hypothetical protein CI755_18570 [Klebsiella pneumoniae subsp. pneumoniae]
MDSVHHIWCPLSSQEFQDLPDGAETTLTEKHELAAGILCVINGYRGDRGLALRQGTIVDATLIHAPSSTDRHWCPSAPPAGA